MNEKNLSQWFNLAEQTPWEVGVYRVELSMKNKPDLRTISEWFAYWDGYKFGSFRLSPDESFRNRNSSLSQDLCNIKWRGLSTNPEVKKKAQNKRKTMYVVIDIESQPVGVFEIKHNAFLCAKKNFWSIKTIRFRTPE